MGNDPFLESREWRTIRMRVLIAQGARCNACGATPASGAIMNVDHIKPRWTHPELALTESNLQVLCDVCNHGKGSWDETDWRPAPAAAALTAPRLRPAERMLVMLALMNADGITDALASLPDETLATLESREFLTAAKCLAGTGAAWNVRDLISSLSDAARKIVSGGALEAGAGPLAGVSPADCVRELRRLELESRQEVLRKRIAARDGNDDDLVRERIEIARQIASL